MSSKNEDQSCEKNYRLKNGNPALDLRTLPRCEATSKTTGKRCGNPAMKGSKYCCVHNGKHSPGAPVGNQNALKTGLYSKSYRDQLGEAKKLVEALKELGIKL